jgi:hypothetical protein
MTQKQRAVVDAAGEIRRLPFSMVGCIVHQIHLPVPAAVELHHVFPVYLQARIWKTVDPVHPSTARDKERIPVCGSGHTDIHMAIDALIGKAKPPKGVGRAELGFAREAGKRYGQRVAEVLR